MNADWKEKWVTALESGQYKQGTDRLRTVRDEFCCLGVLCDVVEPKAWEGGVFEYNEASSDMILPSTVNDITGVEEFEEDELVNMNDSGSTFEEIAAWIKENL